MSVVGLSSTPVRKKRAKVCYSNRGKVLLCYLLAFALPLFWLLCGLWFVYPYQLVSSAPLVMENLIKAFPFLEGQLSGLALQAADPATNAPAAWQEALEMRDGQWMAFLVGMLLAAWALTVLCQIVWRQTHASPYMAARNNSRAIRDYRMTMLLVWGINLAAAAAVWLLGVRFVQGRTAWDYLVYFVPYGLNGAAAILCSRLAAPPVLSGRHGFFKRL